MAKKSKQTVPFVPTVKCKNCIKYESGSWVECEGERFHCETPRICLNAKNKK